MSDEERKPARQGAGQRKTPPQRSQGKWLIAVTVLSICAAAAALALLYMQMRGAGADNQRHPPQFAHMQLQSQYAGPIEGTVIQRWRDPIDGTICYIYLPMVVHHEPAPSGYVEYGSQSIGSISCMAAK